MLHVSLLEANLLELLDAFSLIAQYACFQLAWYVAFELTGVFLQAGGMELATA